MNNKTPTQIIKELEKRLKTLEDYDTNKIKQAMKYAQKKLLKELLCPKYKKLYNANTILLLKTLQDKLQKENQQ